MRNELPKPKKVKLIDKKEFAKTAKLARESFEEEKCSFCEYLCGCRGGFCSEHMKYCWSENPLKRLRLFLWQIKEWWHWR